MKTLIRTLALAGMTALASAHAMAGGATITFTHPENYADFPMYRYDRSDLLKEMADHFIKMAAKLPANQDLKIEVLDFDLAGEQFPRIDYYARDFRILKGQADWPYMKVRFTLTQDGQVIAQGEELIRDMAYLNRMNRYFTGDPLRYEKQMVDDWFRQRLAVR